MSKSFAFHRRFSFFLSPCAIITGGGVLFFVDVLFFVRVVFAFYFLLCFCVVKRAALIIICFVLSVALYYYSTSPFDTTISPCLLLSSCIWLKPTIQSRRLTFPPLFNGIDAHKVQTNMKSTERMKNDWLSVRQTESEQTCFSLDNHYCFRFDIHVALVHF